MWVVFAPTFKKVPSSECPPGPHYAKNLAVGLDKEVQKFYERNEWSARERPGSRY